MPNNPYDDLLKNLARLIEQVTGLEQNMHNLRNIEADTPHIIGCAIITGGLPQNQEIPFSRPLEVQYEIIDAGDVAYLTVALPPHVAGNPDVTVTEETVLISAAGSRAPIQLGFKVLPDLCLLDSRNGVIDLTLVKMPALTGE